MNHNKIIAHRAYLLSKKYKRFNPPPDSNWLLAESEFKQFQEVMAYHIKGMGEDELRYWRNKLEYKLRYKSGI